MEILRTFSGDIGTKEAVINYVTDFIAEEGIRLMFDRKDVSHIADAKMLIDKAFEQLSKDYAIPTKPTTPINEAR